jgi:hypothetical protein
MIILGFELKQQNKNINKKVLAVLTLLDAISIVVGITLGITLEKFQTQC